MSVEFWAEFFQAAGLEPAVSASYANIFFVNKIQPNHFPDIDREALREMGISPMGDILTILKYIKNSCPLVTSPNTAPGNEQLLLYHFRNTEDSKSGCCGQNQFEFGEQHSIANAENSFVSCVSAKGGQIQPVSASHYLCSADTQASGDIPTATLHESPLNLTVHGNSSTNKLSNEFCNSQDLEMPDYETRLNYLCSSVNSTVSCDTSEAPNPTYTISPNKLEMDRCTDGFKNNLEQTMTVSYVDILEQQSVAEENIIIPGGDTPHRKRSVFDRLGLRSKMEEIWVKTSSKQFNQNRHFNNKLRQKCTPQRDNGIMRSNHLRNKSHCSPIGDDRVNNNMESVNTITMGPELLPSLQTKPYNENINRGAVSANHLDIHKMRSKSSTGNSKEQFEVVCNENLNDAGTSNTDRNSCLENSFGELCNTEDISQSLTSRILLSAPQDEKKSPSAADNVELSRKTVTVGPDAIFITRTPTCFSSSPQNEDPELEVLRDPTLTQHTEQYYLHWADRRKRALSFPGFEPSFLQES